MELVIFIGIQATGKSTFYLQNFYRTHVRLNLDMLRTRRREGILFEACLKGKAKCVIDNTNVTREDRTRYIGPALAHGFTIKGYYFRSKLEDALARNALRSGKEEIPEAGVRATYSKLEIPTYDEGFHHLYYVKIEDDMFNVKAWQSDEL